LAGLSAPLAGERGDNAKAPATLAVGVGACKCRLIVGARVVHANKHAGWLRQHIDGYTESPTGLAGARMRDRVANKFRDDDLGIFGGRVMFAEPMANKVAGGAGGLRRAF
jgi:hypothetical protein